MQPSKRSSPAEALALAFADETGCELRVRRVGDSAVLVPEPEAVERFGRFGIVVGLPDESAPQTWAIAWRYADDVELVLWPDAQLLDLDALMRRLICVA